MQRIAEIRLADAAAILGGRRAGAGYAIRCPLHDDRNPSAAIYQSADSGAIWATCFAGCDWREVTTAIRAALGIAGAIRDTPPPPAPVYLPAGTPPDVPRPPFIQPEYPAPPAPLIPGTGWPALYDGETPYTDLLAGLAGQWTGWTGYVLADGAPRYAIRRFPNGHRGWDRDLGRETRGLKPHIWQRPEPGAPYLLIEGEKAAAAAAAACAAGAMPYGVASLPGTAHYATADYSAFDGAGDGDSARRR